MTQKPRVKSSSGDGHPYRKLAFWRNPSNQFWHDPGRQFSQKAKDYYDEWLADMIQNERRSYLISQ